MASDLERVCDGDAAARIERRGERRCLQRLRARRSAHAPADDSSVQRCEPRVAQWFWPSVLE
eukprot:143474-Rhodomonas_salina.1